MLKKLFCSSFLLLLFSFNLYSQEVVNLIFVGDKGATEDIKEAHSFIVVKAYPNNVFERLDYKMGGSLIKLRTYADSNLSILEGKAIEYSEAGNMQLVGDYKNNAKDGAWHNLDDTGKVILKRVYEQGNLVLTEVPDTVKVEKKKENPADKEATFKKGMSAWSRYVLENMDTELTSNMPNGGKTSVEFVIDTTGKTTGIYIRKSSQFVLDEVGLNVIRNSPLWEPAIQDGRKVKAYRIQPFTVLPPEE